MGRLFFLDVNLGKPQFLKLFFERLFGSSSVGVVLQLVNKNKVLVTTPDSREGLKVTLPRCSALHGIY